MLKREAAIIGKQEHTITLPNQTKVEPDLIVTELQLPGGSFHVLSRYADPVWRLPSTWFPDSTTDSKKQLRFTLLPVAFQEITKYLMSRYILKGLEGGVRPRGNTIASLFKYIKPFLVYLSEHNIQRLAQVTPLLTANYVNMWGQSISPATSMRLSPADLNQRFRAVETFYMLSQQGSDVMPHPWPDASAHFLSGMHKEDITKSKTKIIPDAVLAPLFTAACQHIDQAERLLNLRDKYEQRKNSVDSIAQYKQGTHKCADTIDYPGGLKAFQADISALHDACVIIILTTSGIRVHELVNLRLGGYYTTVGERGQHYYWMRSRSDKTHEGNTEWLVSEITHRALKVVERFVEPLQQALVNQIATRELESPNCHEALESRRYQQSLFLGKPKTKKNPIRPLSDYTILQYINRFARRNNIQWDFGSHQFRRSFANYAARSAYGDLRYLRDHFKHWSIDMTAIYMLNEQQDSELYDEIMLAVKNEKISIVEHWLEEDTLLAGGMAEQVRSFRSSQEDVRTYETRVQLAEQISEQVHLRATTVAWCTADDAGCSGRGLADKTRCGDCHNAIIDDRKTAVWQGIYSQQLELRELDDIGEVGRLRVERDIVRCEQVLKQLNVNVENLCGIIE